jgi:hypothetical protein
MSRLLRMEYENGLCQVPPAKRGIEQHDSVLDDRDRTRWFE